MGCKACCQKIPTRYWIMAMIFLTTYINYTTRSNMSISLPAMVTPGKKKIAECLKDVNSDQYTVQNVSEEDTGEKYHWDEKVQGLVLGAYFYGYLIGSLPGGIVAEWIGPFWTIEAMTIAAGILNSACAWVAPVHWGLLFAARFLIGLCGGLIYPALQCLIGRWAPPQERTKFVACLMGNTLGTCLTWIIGGVVIRYYKWPWSFHVMSIQIIVFCLVFGVLAYDSPELHKWITDEELNYIKQSQEGKVSKTKAVPPYKNIFTSFPFWTLCILHFGNLWGLYVQITAVPKFMKEYIGFDIKSSGVLSSFPHLARLFLGFGFGFLGDYLKKKQFKRVIILKSFIILSHIVPGILMALMSVAKCNSTVAVVLLTLSMSINGSVVVTNLANPTDLSPNFAGTIFGIISFIGGISGFIVPSMSGAIITTYGNNGKSWGLVFALGGLIYCGCGIFFMIFGTADTQPWNEKAETEGQTST
ncbi:hypothetical protein ABEB36_015277 [Hypothenemus hampei]|uniref:Major facilitator superfamily (MFS) profile domain-containing protein n=1 Tax=Hypothenemus hampei TaxID=57062 RepID=A0ABD1E1Q8_HYPHA